MRILVVLAAALSVAGALGGCGSPPPPTVSVFAAASLKASFTDLDGLFARITPGERVESTFAGSADLLTQLTQGAPGDVLATADTPTMDKAAEAGLLAGPPTPFATNSLTIVVAPGNPKRVIQFRDLANVSLVVCAKVVPCGSALPQLQRAADVTLNPVSEESSVTDVLNKVTSGQADAGLVYVTDARAAGDKVTTVGFPEAAGAVNTYQIAVLRQARIQVLARRYVDFVIGPTGQQVLQAAGFGKP